MGGTERVEELDGRDVPLPETPEAQELVKPDPNAPVGSAEEAAAEEAYVETIRDAGV
ncbi:hypothetical protein [Methylobacterium sp. E-066]|uniref:hypothetical protein n=1 Tax=Methylobacterium sp. E-066 TaxID=2836584 RepID=UPI001FBB0544|nr:hypothetical protein [Methylobacterium sp. E-066]MCJ2139659.1 hypothetical protein [Methylobacterium sp. E-066]